MRVFRERGSGHGAGLLVAVWVALFSAILPIRGAVLYMEDFSDTSEWYPVYNQNGGAASVTSDGSVGTFSVAEPNNVVAFAPVFPFVSVGPINPARPDLYRFVYDVVSVSYSTSYSIEFDLFDENKDYLGTIFNVVPEGVFVGTGSVSLASMSMGLDTKYILPKVTMRTGDGNQTIQFNNMEVQVLPEPASLMMMGIGLFLFLKNMRKKSVKPSVV